MDKIEKLLIVLVNGLLERKGKSTMAQLNIMCRRYAGFRPFDGSDSSARDCDLGKYNWVLPQTLSIDKLSN